jgi:hypothetical protein
MYHENVDRCGCAVLFFRWYCSERCTEPEFNDVFAGLEAGKLITLERQTPIIQVKSSGFISVNMKTSSEIPGTKSPVRFSSGQPLDFVVRSMFASTPGIDPSTFYTLHRLDIKKKTRGLTMTTVHASVLGATANTDPQAALPVTFSKYGASSIKVAAGLLPPGEYALKSIYSQSVFCFGVD